MSLEEKTVNKEMLTKNGHWLSRQGLYGQPYQSVMEVAWKTWGALLGLHLGSSERWWHLEGSHEWDRLYFILLFQLTAVGTNRHSQGRDSKGRDICRYVHNLRRSLSTKQVFCRQSQFSTRCGWLVIHSCMMALSRKSQFHFSQGSISW